MPSSLRTWCLAAVLALGALGSASTSAAAQEPYPNQNVRFVVAFPAGGPTDVVGRLLGQRLNEKWGQGVVVENRGGAGGNIAARQVAKAEPNGYTLLVTTSAYAVNPSLSKNAGYVPETDFKTVIVAGTTPNIFVASPQLSSRVSRQYFRTRYMWRISVSNARPIKTSGTTPKSHVV